MKKKHSEIYSEKEKKLFRRLKNPAKIQDYINSIPFNFDERAGTCLSPRMVFKKNKADCIEGAIFAAAVLEFHGLSPLLVDLRTTKKPYDYDHVIAVYKKDGYWGAISKTNHCVLRYREPLYRDIRELVVSYFHEYFLGNGKKTLREFSEPFDLNYFNKINWRTTEDHLSKVMEKLDKIKHYKLLTKNQERGLRKADDIEIEAMQYEEYKKR